MILRSANNLDKVISMSDECSPKYAILGKQFLIMNELYIISKIYDGRYTLICVVIKT